MKSTGQLNAETRQSALEALRLVEFDVIVVGAGITGAGIALDAASRGLTVALVEARDLASGTSQWSSKMVHGGLRYLATYQFGIAHESAVERDRLMRFVAPHLVRAQRNVLPFVSSMSDADARLTRVGLWMADALRRAAHTPSSLLPAPSRVDVTTVRAGLPGWQQNLVRGGLQYWDGALEDDARLVINVVRTAAAHGAQVATYTRAISATDHRVELVDELTGQRIEARARCVIAAPGVWAPDFTDELEVVPSRGTHVVIEAEKLGGIEDVVTIPVPGQRGRYVFFKPAPDGLVYIGLTDVEAPEADGWNPGVPEAEVEELLAAANAVLAQPLTRADVAGTFSGLRPLVAQPGRSSADTARDHVVVDRPGQPVVMTGGKLTTYRAMAREAVDVAAERLRRAGREVKASQTATLPLLGAADPKVLQNLPENQRLVARYGTLAAQVDALIAEDPELGKPVTPASNVTFAELVYGVLYEGAMTESDLVDRRTRLSMRDAVAEDARCAARRAFEWAGVRPAETTASARDDR